MDFSEIKNMYNEARTEERNKISRFFHTQDDFETEKPAARAGVKNYNSGGRLIEEYDLSNWKWICVKRNDVHFFVYSKHLIEILVQEIFIRLWIESEFMLM